MAREMIDIGVSLSDDDLIIEDGDFVDMESTLVHQRQLLLNEKGSFKENPTICVGLREFLDDENPTALLREIRMEFVHDGMQVKSVEVVNGKIKTDAHYKA